MVTYATKQDVISLFRALTADEITRTEALLPVICSELRMEAKKVGKDLDALVAADEDLAYTAKMVTVNVVARALQSPTAGSMGSLSQYSQSAMGYTVSGTFLSPGDITFIKNADLKALGLKRQQIGAIDLMGKDDSE